MILHYIINAIIWQYKNIFIVLFLLYTNTIYKCVKLDELLTVHESMSKFTYFQYIFVKTIKYQLVWSHNKKTLYAANGK